jgi:hypothetical protein
MVEPEAESVGSVAATATAPTPTTALAAIALKSLISRAFTTAPSTPTPSLPWDQSNGGRGIFHCVHVTAPGNAYRKLGR